MSGSAQPFVFGVFASGKHDFSKSARDAVILIEGLGIEGDAHLGITVQHLYDARRDPTRPNFRQVHLIQAELLDEVNGKGFRVQPGDMGENISTRGIDLLGLPTGTRLHLGPAAVIEVTGLRNPCRQIDKFQKGLQAAVNAKAAGGGTIRRAGVMSVILKGGVVRPNDAIAVEWPDGPCFPLRPV
jgi:MOSC domain-containing protein YiiM